jgi:uncharacterized protein (TIGR04141 family)
MPRGSNQPKTRTFTIFLLKDDSSERPIKALVGVTEHEVRFENGDRGTLYVQHSQGRPPAWLSFFVGSIPSLTERILNANTAAVLILGRTGKRFAIAFGFGRHLLASGAWEEDFGLRTTLNSVDRKRIRSIDRMSLDSIGQHSQIQASREADINEFGLDLEQDLLRAVTGTPSDAALGKRLTGKDALQITTSISLNELPSLLDRLLVQWRKEDYKATFPWIDQIQELKDVNKKNELDNVLVEKIKRGDSTRLWLTIPQIIDWSVVEGFKYKYADDAPIHGDVHLDSFRRQFGHIENLTADDLRHQHVIAVSHEGGHEIESWSIHRCIYCEVDQGTTTYLLTNGHWYKVGTAFLQRVTGAFDAIPRASITLPDYTDASEALYNARIGREHPDIYAVMDLNPIPMGGHDQVEFCDLFERTKKIIHVKRYTGSSAPLSHLCAQTIVSGTLFRRDSEFRQNVNEKLPARFRPVTTAPGPQEYEIIFGIVSVSRNQLVLPLFSRINLKNACARLQDLGYKISLLKIQAIERSPSRAERGTTDSS